ncbi:tail fiber protein [Luteimonas sp. RD2P54]|uniref:Tail fiber protein n=1 Tax=Luteimonas endophytica TaxID=3042023 RepID=A0ABT6J779_9GAMM|nr:tail fiber protein [Luteimonas endophytica]MDH5822687.1 tail fiber protein [Luteimonas endophytica]
MSTPFVGEIRMFGFGRTPLGWQACDGSLLPISEYEMLFMLVGTTYGGDGQNTFGVPDLRGRLPVSQGQGPGLGNYTLGQTGGAETVTLTQTQLPAHSHPLQATTATATAVTPGPGLLPGAVGGDTFYVSTTAGNTAAAMSSQMLRPMGGSQPHENCMPTLTVQYCIATEGVFPQQA